MSDEDGKDDLTPAERMAARRSERVSEAIRVARERAAKANAAPREPRKPRLPPPPPTDPGILRELGLGGASPLILGTGDTRRIPPDQAGQDDPAPETPVRPDTPAETPPLPDPVSPEVPPELPEAPPAEAPLPADEPSVPSNPAVAPVPPEFPVEPPSERPADTPVEIPADVPPEIPAEWQQAYIEAQGARPYDLPAEWRETEEPGRAPAEPWELPPGWREPEIGAPALPDETQLPPEAPSATGLPPAWQETEPEPVEAPTASAPEPSVASRHWLKTPEPPQDRVTGPADLNRPHDPVPAVPRPLFAAQPTVLHGAERPLHLGLPRAPTLLHLGDVHTDIGRYRILQGVEMTVPEGRVTMVLGRNGVGKTTTLRTIMGLWRARKGKITLKGTEIARRRPTAIARMGVGYVPEGMGIFADLSVAENMRLGAVSGPLDRHRLDWLLSVFPPLATFWRSPAGTLSGGQKQMLALARTMAEPRMLYLIDEPTKGLAPAIVTTLVSALKALKDEGATILMVEQNFAVARALGDHVVVMDDGRTVWHGDMDTLAGDAALQTRLMGLALEEGS